LDVLDLIAVSAPQVLVFFAAGALALIPVECQQFPNAHKINDYALRELHRCPSGFSAGRLSAAAVGSFARLLESNLRIRNGGAMVSEDFRKQALGYGLTTAHILYRRPDHRWLLQSYIWQNYDLFPEFPELHRFLAFWQEKLEGPLHSVRVAHCKLIKPAEIKAIDGEFRLQ
jgi:uncharacterized protein Usg